MKQTVGYIVAILLATPNYTLAENWYVKDWYGAKSEGSCIIATEDEKRGKSIYFSFSDGRFSFNNNTFNPTSALTVSNIIPNVLDTTYFEVSVVFNDTLSFDTVLRSSVVSGAADLSSTSISRNEVVDFFQSKELDHELLVKLMKKSDTMKFSNNKMQTIAKFSMFGFTKIFSNYTECIRSLEP
jgi:hypothetical protein